MKTTYHLALNRYIFYVLMSSIGLVSIGLLLGLIFIGVMSDVFVSVLTIVSFLLSIMFFYFHVIIINENTLVFSQKIGFKRVIVNIDDVREIIIKEYRPKHDARFIRVGYKINLKKTNAYIKIIKGQYGLKARQAIFLKIISNNQSVKLNKRMQKEVDSYLVE